MQRVRGVAFWRSVPPLLLAVVVASIVALSSLASSLDDAPLPQLLDEIVPLTPFVPVVSTMSAWACESVPE